MIFIKDYLNKIRWDDRMKPEEYTLTYLDRNKEEKEVPYLEIKEIGDDYIRVEKDKNKGFVEIPMHRIRKIKKSGFIVWQRYGTKEI
ncbi:DUF504 domain-containing protein [Candidatus Woesearchaeota archaeon]|nr:DUF504 domain-containing protein [Candidatus Woesearchaeota archaeon]